MGPFPILLPLFLVAPLLATPGTESRQAAVNRAIEQTKRRQSAPPLQNSRSTNRNMAGGRSENLDVERLNALLRTLDKTWIMPRVGAKEPVGSNFQYKKTCASIYKARHGACQQLGFGTMCFNYCHERGEKLAFKCQDTSEASYCRQSAIFDTFIAKYRKDAYKAKAYVHQMISRCYATAVCNTQTGILNSTLVEEDIQPETTTKLSRLRITKPAGGFKMPGPTAKGRPQEEASVTKQKAVKQRKYKTTTTTMAVPEEEEELEVEVVEEVTSTRMPARRTTTQKANIWDKFTVGQKSKATPKYIPFWQKLMTTTLQPPHNTGDKSIAEEGGEIEETIVRQTATEPEITTDTMEPEEEKEATDEEPETVEMTETTVTPTSPVTHSPKKTTRMRHTFKPLPVTTPPQIPDLAFMKPIDPSSSEHVPGFWNKFQPGRWYQSIHYMTNTGRR